MKISLPDGLKHERVQTNLGVAFLISLTLFAFGSLNLYFTNISEFSFLFSQIWYFFLALVLFLLAGIFLLLQKCNHRYEKKVTALFFAIGLLLWIQGNIMVWNYGLLDGHVIFWGDYFWYGIMDALVWIGVLAICMLKSDALYKHIRVVCLLLIVVQFAGILATVYAAPDEPAWKYQNSSEYPGTLLQFSSDTNVIIIILDTYQSDVFQEIIQEDEKYKDMFDGFTYYRNTVGGFSTTYPSVTLILSGDHYDNSVPIKDFIKNSALNTSIPVVLKQNGFRTSSSEDSALIYRSHEVFDDIAPGPSEIHRYYQDTKRDDAQFLAALTLFRHLPQPLKMVFFSQPFDPNAGKMNPDMILYERFTTEVSGGSPNATFKLMHLRGAHVPYVLNENLEFQKLPSNRTGYKATAKADLSITDALLTNLKNQGMYNNSFIFIMGDHGSHTGEIAGLPYDQEKNQGNDSRTVSTKVVGKGIPLLLVKPINATGGLSISDAPVTLGDIPKTIADSYGIANNFPGESLLNVTGSDERTRVFYAYDWLNDDWDKQYLPPMTEYQVNGFSWDPASWKPSYRVFTPHGVEYTPPVLYQPGTIIRFGTGEDAEQYLGSGWSYPEKDWIWTDAASSYIFLPMNTPPSDLMLTLQFSPFLVKNTLDQQRMIIRVNGHPVANTTISEPGSQEIVVQINQSILEGDMQTLTFELPDAMSPYEKGISGDTRTLGIAVQTLSLAPPV